LDGSGKEEDRRDDGDGELEAGIEKLVGGLSEDEERRRAQRIHRDGLARGNHADQKNCRHGRRANAGGLPARNKRVKEKRGNDDQHTRAGVHRESPQQLPEDHCDHADMES